jgi:hypothetical protein
LSGFPVDVGWPNWGKGLRIVYSHDGPFGIYGTRIFVPFPASAAQERPVVVQSFDSPEQIILTSLLSAAGRWNDTLSTKSRYDHGNWRLLRMYGSHDRHCGFGYDRKSNLGSETIRVVAAVSFSFHRTFGAIRCSAECDTTRTLGDFDSDESCDEWILCHTCIDPNAPFHPIIRSATNGTLALAGNRLYEVEIGQTEMQLPTKNCKSHPVCGRCRYEQNRQLEADLEQHYEDPWSSDS